MKLILQMEGLIFAVCDNILASVVGWSGSIRLSNEIKQIKIKGRFICQSFFGDETFRYSGEVFGVPINPKETIATVINLTY